MGSVRRRDLLKGVAGAAAAATIACRVSPPGADLTVERVTIGVPGLHPAHDGLRVAQLSDFHLGGFTPDELVRAAIAAANAFAPELIVLTGDYLTRYHLVRKQSGPGVIVERLGGLTAPTVAVLGNHDWFVDGTGAASALERLGYCVLRNESTTLRLRGEPLTIVGIDDQWTRHADPARAMKGVGPGSRMCLAHVPVTADLLRYLGQWLLVLAGHQHGGQLNFPPISTAIELKAGLYRRGRVQLYVNRGIGNSWMPLRVNAPPEVTYLTLRSVPFPS